MSELLDFKAKVDFTQAKRDVEDFEKMLARVGVAPAPRQGETQAISGYRQAQLALQETLRNARLETERLKQSAQQYRTEVEQGRVAQQNARTATEQLRTSEQALRNSHVAGRITQQQYDQQLVQTRIDLQQQNATLVQSRTNTENARTALAQLNLQQRQLAAQTRAARAAQQAASGSYNEATARLRQLATQIRSVTGGFEAQGPVQAARIAEYNRLNAQITEFDRRMGHHQRNVGNYSSVLRGASGQLAGFVSTYASAAAAIAAVGATFNQALKSDAVRTSLEFTFGSVDLADAKLEQLLETANRLGVNYEALTSSYKSFTGAVIASGYDFQEGERIFNAVAGASSRLKLSSEDTEGALRALQQMISKGNVQAEELRGQLGERIPGAFSIAARAMGKTETELNKMLQKGEVLAADLLPKLSVELEKTFGLDSTTAVQGLTAETEKFKNIFTGLVSESSNTSKFFSTVVRGFNEIAGMFADLVNSDSWNEFWVRMISGKESGDAIKGLNKSLSQTKSAVEKSLELNEDSDVKSISLAYEGLKLSLENATKARDLYNKKIKEGYIKDKDGKLLTLENDIAVNAAKVNQVKALLDAAKKDTPNVKTSEQTAAEKKAAQEAEAALKAQRSLQKKITDIKNESFRKTLTKDEEEIQAVKDKFAKIRTEIEEHNKKMLAKKSTSKYVTDGSGLEGAMKAQITSVEYKQETEKLKESLDIQKGLYDEFESYKIALGKKAANERFSSEIDVNKKYADILQVEYDKILEQGSKTGFTGAMTERMKTLEVSIRKEAEVEQKRQDDLMKSLLSFDQERKVLEENYQRDKLDVLAKGGGKSLEVLDKNYKTQLAALGDAHLQQLDAFKLLYQGIDRLSDRNALNVVGTAEDALKALKSKGVVISKELEAELRRLFGDTRKAIAARLPEQIINLANDIDRVADAVGGIDEQFGKVLSTLGNVVGQVGNIKKGMLDMKTAGKEGDTLGQLGAGLGVVSAGISIFKTVFSLFDRSQQREEQAAYARDLQNKQTEAVNKALERQIALLNDAYGTDRMIKFNEAISQATANEAKYQEQLKGRLQLSGDKTLDKYIEKFNAGEKIPFYIQEVFDQLEKKGASLKLPTAISDLQRLLDEGKLDAGTSVIVQNLLKAGEAAAQLKNQLDAENVGSSLGQVADDFIKTLTDGTQDFGKSFEDTIRTSILNGFKGKLIEQQLQAFYTQFADLSTGGLTAGEIETLRTAYTTAAEKAKKDIEDLEKATGIKLTGDKSSDPSALKPNTLTASLNQPTGERLEGLWRGQFDLTKQLVAQGQSSGLTQGEMLQIGKSKLAALERIAVSTETTAGHTARLETIEAALVLIEKNTKPVKSARD